MTDEVVINLFKKVARILEDDKQYEWLADEVKDYLNEIYVNKAFEPEQEPVAWMWKKHTAGGWLDVVSIDKPTANAHQINIRPLYYTAPPKREPLTDEAVCKILLKKEWKGFVDLVRIIEKEHGIGVGE
jgi:hypothetical protein